MNAIDYWQALLVFDVCVFPLLAMWLVECTIRAFVARDGADSYFPDA